MPSITPGVKVGQHPLELRAAIFEPALVRSR
jgi:hypothetical protein